jgi:hypothetical protein
MRHTPGAQLADDSFRPFGGLLRMGQIHFGKRKATGLQLVIVTAGTVLVNQCALCFYGCRVILRWGYQR